MGTCLVAPAALAQERIGQAALVHNSLVRVATAGATAVNAGDDVIRRETLRTGNDSSARLAFIDNTNLSMGPASTVTLDRFVYDPNPDAQQAAMNLGKGAFRFLTGKLDKKAYEIRTPVAVLGVRGTVLDILVEAGRTFVSLQDGIAIVCRRSAGTPQAGKAGCVTLQGQNQFAEVTAKGVRALGSGWTFAAYCDRDPNLCAAPTFARAGRCVEGVTLAGTCADPNLSAGLRQRVIVFSQPKFSYTAPIYPPRQDRDLQIPRDFHESVQFLF